MRAERDDIRMLAQQLTKDKGCVGKESLNHIELMISGIAVELHPTPAILNNPLYNHRLQKWLKRNVDLQCSNVVELPDDAGGNRRADMCFQCCLPIAPFVSSLFL